MYSWLSWLMFVPAGIGPNSGPAVHFKHSAPEPKVSCEAYPDSTASGGLSQTVTAPNTSLYGATF